MSRPRLSSYGRVMRLILVGPPGTGKGTQAKLLSKRLGLTHIGTGDILREAVRLDSPLGQMARPYVDQGRLVPDDLVNELVADRFRRNDRPDRFVMDGYPRTLAQAASFEKVLEDQDLNLTAVILIVTDDGEIVRRLTGRWCCPKCKTTYHVLSNPPRRAGYCDDDNIPLIQRVDDQETTVRERLRLYHETTRDMVQHFRRRGLLYEVPGLGDIETIYRNIVAILNQAK